jgi:hypothetical protein
MTAEHLPGLEPTDPRDGTTTPTRRPRRWALTHLVVGHGPDGSALFTVFVTGEDGTTEDLAERVDLQTALAITADYAQAQARQEEP